MKPYLIVTSLITGLLVFPSVASAGPLLNRLENQNLRIYKGSQYGSLTYHEYKQLEKHADAIQAQRARDIRDGGGLTPYEAMKLDQRLNRQSHRIYQQKHD